MLIRQRRIRSVDRYLGYIDEGANIIIALPDLDQHAAAARALGFSASLLLGETLLPPPQAPVSRFNAHGGETIHRDRPKETVYHQIEWTWTEWHGRDRVERTRIIDVPHERYPRTPIAAPAIELTIAETASGAKALITPAIAYSPGSADALRHRINLLLEIFGECAVLTEDLEPLLRAPTRRVNWQVLPAGRLPWSRLERELEPVLDEMGPRKRPVAEHRLRFLGQFDPDFTAVGRAGFRGYVVFGFDEKGLYVLESARYGNATYVFDEDWEELSQRTKAEILEERLHTERLIHTERWDDRVRSLLR